MPPITQLQNLQDTIHQSFLYLKFYQEFLKNENLITSFSAPTNMFKRHKWLVFYSKHSEAPFCNEREVSSLTLLVLSDKSRRVTCLTHLQVGERKELRGILVNKQTKPSHHTLLYLNVISIH